MRQTALFWDYENVPLPGSIPAASAYKAISDALKQHICRIEERKVYYDREGGAPTDELCSNGFTMVHAPSRGQKESSDNKLIVDMFSFVWYRYPRDDISPKPCVVLITGDGDYAYALNKLKDGGVKTIILHGKDAGLPSDLKSIADSHMSIFDDVLDGNIRGAAEDNARHLHNIVLQEVSKPNSKAENRWIPANGVASNFYSMGGLDSFRGKLMYQEARDFAIRKGWLERGRRLDIGSAGKGEITAAIFNGGKYSKEDFLRAVSSTAIGSELPLCQTSAVPPLAPGVTEKLSSMLFVKNIPRDASILDLIEFLQTQHNVVILCAASKPWHPTVPYTFAHIKVENNEDAAKLIDLSKKSLLELSGRLLELIQDRTKGHTPSYVRGAIETDLEKGATTLAFSKIVHLSESGNRWARSDVVDKRFQRYDVSNNRITSARVEAQLMGYVEYSLGTHHQRQLSGFNHIRYQDVLPENGSNLYIRLTYKGGQLVRSHPPVSMNDMTHDRKRKTANNNLFLTNLPVGMTVLELVAYLQSAHSLSVKKACIDPIRPDCKYGVGHVELETTHDAERMLHLSARSALVHEARSIDASEDKNVPDWESYCPTRVWYNPPVPVDVCAGASIVPSTLTMTSEDFRMESSRTRSIRA